jgi:hypothetical protein
VMMPFFSLLNQAMCFFLWGYKETKNLRKAGYRRYAIMDYLRKNGGLTVK